MKKCSKPNCPHPENKDDAKICQGCGWKFPTDQDKRRNDTICFTLMIGAVLLIVALFLPVVKLTLLSCFFGCSPVSTQEVSEYQLSAVYVSAWVNSQQQQGYTSSQYVAPQPVIEIAKLYAPDVPSTIWTGFVFLIYAGVQRKLPLSMRPTPHTPKKQKPKKTTWGYVVIFASIAWKTVTFLHTLFIALNPPNLPNVTLEKGYWGSGEILSMVASATLLIGITMLKVEERRRNTV